LTSLQGISRLIIKIADFGLGRVFKQNEMMKTKKVGSKLYMAPEMSDERVREYEGQAVDVWSCGVILFVMITSYPPVTIDANDWYFARLRKNDYKEFWKAHSQWTEFSEAAKDLLTKMLCVDPARRIKIVDILAHPWLSGITLSTNDMIDEFKNRKHEVDQKKPRLRPKPDSLDDKSTDTLQAGQVDRDIEVPTTHPILPGPASSVTSWASTDWEEEKNDAQDDSFAQLYQETRQVLSFSTFRSPLPPSKLLASLKRVLEGNQIRFSVLTGFKLDAKRQTPSDGVVKFRIQIYRDDVPNGISSIVVFRRTAGDTIQFQNTFFSLRGQLKDVISATTPSTPTGVASGPPPPPVSP